MSVSEDFVLQLKRLTDKQLLEEVAKGPDNFRKGFYHYYLQEIRDRGIDVDEPEIEKLKDEQKEKEKSEKDKQLKLSVILLIFLCGGLLCFIPGIQLLKKDNEGNPLYKSRDIGFIGIGISIVVWIGLIALLLFVLFS